MSVGTISARHVDIIITSGGVSYLFTRGGLPLTGNLQTILEAEEASLWEAAESKGVLATDTDLEIAAAIAWYKANGGAKTDVFDKTVLQLVTDITVMVTASFPPPISAAVRTGWIRTLMSSLLDTRVNGRDRDLV